MSARRVRGTCTIDGCDKVDDGPHGYCKMHMTRIRRHGSPDVVKPTGRLSGSAHPAWAGAAVSYSGAHMRVRAVRGNAKLHTCACGAQAQQWAYDHRDPAELVSAEGPYSADPMRYEPKCVPCHKRADLAHLRSEAAS